MSYDVVGGTGGGNQQSKKSIPHHLGAGITREVKDGDYPIRPGQPGKYAHEPIHAAGVKEGHTLPPFQPGQAPPRSIKENVQKQQGTVGGSGTGTVRMPTSSSGIDISDLLSKAIHVPDFSTIISKCTGSLPTPEIEQPPMFQSAAAKLELEPLDEKMPLREQPSTNPDALFQQQSEQQQHQLLQHQPPPHDSYQHHPLQPQGDHPILEQLRQMQQQQQSPPQEQSTSIEWTPPPSHLVQEPRVALQNQQQPLSNWEGTTVTPSQPLPPPPPQPQWIISNVASQQQQQQQPQLNDAKGHLTDERNPQENVGWGSRTNTHAISELTYQNGVPSSQPTGRSEQQHQQQLQNPTPMTWGHQPSHRLASQQHPQPPHRPIESVTEQWSSSQPVPSPIVVHVRHLLVKHCGSRNPTSLKDPTGGKIRQRSIEEAVETLMRLRMEAMDGDEMKFADLATQWSDCNSSKRGGDLGSFGRGKMQPPFEAVAFKLPVGRINSMLADLATHNVAELLQSFLASFPVESC